MKEWGQRRVGAYTFEIPRYIVKGLIERGKWSLVEVYNECLFECENGTCRSKSIVYSLDEIAKLYANRFPAKLVEMQNNNDWSYCNYLSDIKVSQSKLTYIMGFDQVHLFFRTDTGITLERDRIPILMPLDHGGNNISKDPYFFYKANINDYLHEIFTRPLDSDAKHYGFEPHDDPERAWLYRYTEAAVHINAAFYGNPDMSPYVSSTDMHVTVKRETSMTEFLTSLKKHTLQLLLKSKGSCTEEMIERFKNAIESYDHVREAIERKLIRRS